MTEPAETPTPTNLDLPPIRVGVSACVIGQEVRFDGGHKKDRFVTGRLADYVEFVPACPEVELGMGIPRETLRLVNIDDKVHLIANKSGEDHTEAMTAFAQKKAEAIAQQGLHGFILKRASPSCGMERVKIYPTGNKAPRKDGVGLFAAALLARLPNLPIEEEGRLNDPWLRENFVERLFAYQRIRTFFESDWSQGDLIAFHACEKLFVLAHDTRTYQRLGRLVADAKGQDREVIAAEYEALFMKGLKKIASRGKQTNTLQHIAGYLKKPLDAGDRVELTECILNYRQGLVPLVVPLTLLKHHVRRHGIDYLLQQTYLQPHPKELMLRNHV